MSLGYQFPSRQRLIDYLSSLPEKITPEEMRSAFAAAERDANTWVRVNTRVSVRVLPDGNTWEALISN